MNLRRPSFTRHSSLSQRLGVPRLRRSDSLFGLPSTYATVAASPRLLWPVRAKDVPRFQLTFL